MDKKKAILSTVSTFISLVILPIYSVKTIVSIGITIPDFDPLIVTVLGVSITIFALLDSLIPEKSGALFTLIKYIASAYYSYKILNMFSWFTYRAQQAYAELYVDWGLWLIMVVTLTILSGILSALRKVSEKPKEEEKKKS
ncbi:MAG: hypothetical protein ACTSX9_00090 [Candidatus Njordarchaeales archaeon]